MAVEQPDLDAPAQLRTHRLKLAVVTSLCSKISTIGVQVLALPVAVRALGAERFGVYVALAASLNWISMAAIGMGPSLTMGIAASAAKQDRQAERRYFSSAFVMISIISTALLLLLTSGARYISIPAVFGASFSKYSAEMHQGLVVIIVCLAASLMISVIEAAQFGYQEQYITNLWTVLGNGFSIVGLLAFAWFSPSIMGMILCVFCAPLLARGMNGMVLLGIRRPYLRPRLQYADFRIARALVGTGLAFTLIQASGFLNNQASLLLVGRFLSPTAVAKLGVMVQIISLLAGMVAMFAQPLWPALTDAVHRQDVLWARRAYRKIVRFAMLYALAVGFILAAAGRPLIHLWFGARVVPDLLLQITMGAYFALSVWEYVYATVLIGLQKVWIPAMILLGRSLLAVVAASVLIPRLGAAGAGVALCLSVALVSLWMLPVLTHRVLTRLTHLAPAPAAKELDLEGATWRA